MRRALRFDQHIIRLDAPEDPASAESSFFNLAAAEFRVLPDATLGIACRLDLEGSPPFVCGLTSSLRPVSERDGYSRRSRVLYEHGLKIVAKKIQHSRSIQVIGIVKIFSIVGHQGKIIKGHPF